MSSVKKSLNKHLYISHIFLRHRKTQIQINNQDICTYLIYYLCNVCIYAYINTHTVDPAFED